MRPSLTLHFAWWYFFAASHVVFTVSALRTADGHAGVSTAVAQLGIGSLYALLIWLFGYNLLPILGFGTPTVQKRPTVGRADAIAMLRVAILSAGAHICTLIALENGSVFFVMVVKAGEPVASAIVSTVAYGKTPSVAKWVCSLVIVGAITALATSVACPDCSGVALVAASISNVLAALKGGEHTKLMGVPGFTERLNGVGNQHALNLILSFLVSLPALLTEWNGLGALTNPAFISYTAAAGISFYLYNELTAETIEFTGACTASVANAMKRGLLIFGVQAWVGHSARSDFTEQINDTTLVIVSALTAILGALAYSVIDDIIKAGARRPPSMV